MKRKKGKERARRKKGGKEEIEMLAILVFVKVFLAKKKTVGRKSPFGRNIFNNPARYIYLVNVLILIFTLDALIATHMNIIFYSV